MDGPDCGVNGCAREVGHLGQHRRDPAKSRAAYMREYRAKHRAYERAGLTPEVVRRNEALDELARRLADVRAENVALREEVARLNGTTPDRVVLMKPADAAYREFRPAPKPGKGK